jgi:hypothetical protein
VKITVWSSLMCRDTLKDSEKNLICMSRRFILIYMNFVSLNNFLDLIWELNFGTTLTGWIWWTRLLGIGPAWDWAAASCPVNEWTVGWMIGCSCSSTPVHHGRALELDSRGGKRGSERPGGGGGKPDQKSLMTPFEASAWAEMMGISCCEVRTSTDNHSQWS